MKPRLKPYVHVFQKDETRFIFCDWGKRKVQGIEASPQVAGLLSLADGSHTLEELVQLCHGLSEGQVNRFFQRLRSMDIVLDDDNPTPDVSPSASKIAESLETFATSSKAAISMLKQIQRARVAVIGIGGIGSWAVQTLAMQEIGELVLIDPDRVELSNLHRQAFYLRTDVGQPKVVCAAQVVKQISPLTRVSSHMQRVEADSPIDWIPDVDLLISCADEPSATAVSLILSRLCFQRKIPHIVGAGYSTAVGNFPQTIIPVDPTSACLRCHRSNITDSLGRFLLKGEGGIPLAPLVAIMGQLIALEALRVITKFDIPLFLNRRGDLNFLDLSISLHSISRQPDCSFCSALRG